MPDVDTGTFMNQSSPKIATATPSEDQQAIAKYFASETYARTKSRPFRASSRPGRSRWPDRSLAPTTSFVMGLAGLSAMLFVLGTLAPMLTGELNWAMETSDNYVIFTMLDQTMIYPAIIVFAFVAVTPMFWYGSVLLRFVLAAILIVPACFGFLSQSDRLDPPGGFPLMFTTVGFATFLTIGAVAVLVQMWSHWTLSHSRQIDAPLAPTGTRSIMELTVVTAVGCFAFLSVDASDFVEMLLLFMALGLCTAVAVLGMLIAFLRPGRRNFFAASISALFAFGGSFIYSGMHAFNAFGWGKLPSMLLPMVGASIYGAAVFGVVMCICVWWLRACGWVCLSRDDERQVRETASQDLWYEPFFSKE
jgi:hypothetical protein